MKKQKLLILNSSKLSNDGETLFVLVSLYIELILLIGIILVANILLSGISDNEAIAKACNISPSSNPTCYYYP